MPPRSLAYTRIRKRKRDSSPSRHDNASSPPVTRHPAVIKIGGSDVEEELNIEGSGDNAGHAPPAVCSRAAVEIEGSDIEEDLDVTTKGSDVEQDPDIETEEDNEPFAPDQYKSGLHYFHNRRCTNAECRREIPRKSLKRCGTCFQVTYCTPECQQKDWSVHKAVCQPIPPGEHTRAVVRFNYRYGRYIHALALYMLAFMELPRCHARHALWRKASHTFAVVLHVRQHEYTTHHHPYHDYRFASTYCFRINMLDILEPGFKARAEALINARPNEKTCVVVIMFEDKAGLGVGSGCFLHKVDEFKINEYPRVSTYSAPTSFRRILKHKARKNPHD